MLTSRSGCKTESTQSEQGTRVHLVVRSATGRMHLASRWVDPDIPRGFGRQFYEWAFFDLVTVSVPGSETVTVRHGVEQAFSAN